MSHLWAFPAATAIPRWIAVATMVLMALKISTPFRLRTPPPINCGATTKKKIYAFGLSKLIRAPVAKAEEADPGYSFVEGFSAPRHASTASQAIIAAPANRRPVQS
jgi:hypothetical protein